MGQGDYSQTGQVTDENNQQMEDDQELEGRCSYFTLSLAKKYLLKVK